MKCYGCGVAKDTNFFELYPYPEEDGIVDRPIAPLFVIEVQSGSVRQDFRACVVCHECFHKLSPDMWISQIGWESITPRLPFDQLPTIKDYVSGERWNPSSYDEI